MICWFICKNKIYIIVIDKERVFVSILLYLWSEVKLSEGCFYVIKDYFCWIFGNNIVIFKMCI